MIETSEAEIISKAKWLNGLKKPWHFHLLTPDCVFNRKGGFVLVLETPIENSEYVNYSEIKQEESAKLLLELLHGIKADEKQVSKTNESVSDAVKKMETRAKELTEKKIAWHHHALFPDCVFNDKKGKWKMILEDPETKEVLESVTDEKPNEELKVIEPLFYHQNI